MDDLGYIPLEQVQRLIDKVGATSNKEDVMLSFEFLIGSLFPDSYQNLKNLVAMQYIKGYMDGQASLEGVSET